MSDVFHDVFDESGNDSGIPDEEVEKLRYGFHDQLLGRYRVRTREEYHERGIEISNWIEDPNHPNCPCSLSELTPAQISEMANGENRSVATDDNSIEKDLVMPPGFQPRPWIFWSARVINTSLEGFFGNGAIVIDIMNRRGGGGPHVSELAAVRYAAEYPIEDLRHVFVTTVVNKEFRHYMKMAKFDKDELKAGKTFERGSTEYFSFMGTRVGRVVGSILLAAFPRGSRRISSIHLWEDDWAPSVRFDIERL